MIHSAKPTNPPVAITILNENYFVLRDHEKWTDRQTIRVKIVITTGRVWVGLVDQQAHAFA